MGRVSKARQCHNRSRHRDKLKGEVRTAPQSSNSYCDGKPRQPQGQIVRSSFQLSQVAPTSVLRVTIFSPTLMGCAVVTERTRWQLSNDNSECDLVISWHQTGTIKNQPGSIRTIPFGRADMLSPQPRISSRGANQRPSEVPTRWVDSSARCVSVHLHSRKMKPPWLHHGPKTERPAASHHRSDFGWES